MPANPTPHHVPIPLSGWDASALYSSAEEPTKLVVLVHGFISQSAKTWPKLDAYLLAAPAYSRTDMLFWDYNSRTRDIPGEALRLRSRHRRRLAARPHLRATGARPTAWSQRVRISAEV